MPFLTEKILEDDILRVMATKGWITTSGPALEASGERSDFREALLPARMKQAVRHLNPWLTPDKADEVVKAVRAVQGPNLLVGNEAFHKLLCEGVPVAYKHHDGSIRHDQAWLIDWQRPELNELLAVQQLTVQGEHKTRRMDIVLYVNGLPLAVLELKNAASLGTTVQKAYNQIITYRDELPALFTYNQLMVVSDGYDAQMGTLSADFSRYSSWKSVDGVKVAKPTDPLLYTMVEGLFQPSVLLDLIRNFIVFERAAFGDAPAVKKVAAYHQFYAVNKAVQRTREATSPDGDRRSGVVWHTQGSGKSLSMVFYAGKIIQALDNPTLVVLTDRNDLDDQLFGTFSACQHLLRQTPKQADSRAQLRDLLKVASGGVVFATIQKFLPEEKGDKMPQLSDRRNIVVIADEAHRSQYDFLDGFARHLHDALPNASFIGFTGTPIEKEDANTVAVFGDYIDIYDIQRAVEDGATVPIYYEGRLVKIDMDEASRAILDQDFEELTEAEELDDRRKLKAKWAQLEAIVGTPSRIKQVAADIVQHFEARSEAQEGKGMIVAMSRRLAARLYEEIVAIRPDWHGDDLRHGAIKVVMTGNAMDAPELKRHIRSKGENKKIADRLKDPQDPLKLVIVRDMWLTGFDAPVLHTLYVDKPMKGHSLAQAIARVNRVYKDKQGGLVVDYIGIAADLKKAVETYSASGGHGQLYRHQEDAVAALQKFNEIIVGMFQQAGGFDYQQYFQLTELKDRLTFHREASDFILGLELDGKRDGKQRFTTHVSNLLRAFALAVPHDKALALRDDIILFQEIRAVLLKPLSGTNDVGLTDAEIETSVRRLVELTLVSNQVIDIFQAAGLARPELSILSEAFLEEVRGMKHQNLAAELLRRLLEQEIKMQFSKNEVQDRKFSEQLDQAVQRYHNGMLTTVEILEELMRMARDVKAAVDRGEKLGLSTEEVAFYDALVQNESAVRELKDETLKAIARELVNSIRSNTGLDWKHRENVRAAMRLAVKRILRKYKYPPDETPVAVELIIQQSERLFGE